MNILKKYYSAVDGFILKNMQKLISSLIEHHAKVSVSALAIICLSLAAIMAYYTFSWHGINITAYGITEIATKNPDNKESDKLGNSVAIITYNTDSPDNNILSAVSNLKHNLQIKSSMRNSEGFAEILNLSSVSLGLQKKPGLQKSKLHSYIKISSISSEPVIKGSQAYAYNVIQKNTRKSEVSNFFQSLNSNMASSNEGYKNKAAVAGPLKLISGVIKNSFYQSGIDKGIPTSKMLELIKAYSYDIDFQRDIRAGDRFKVLIDESEESSKIAFASLEVRGKPVEIYHYTSKDGYEGFFTKDGKSVRKSLLKTPVGSARISSRFGMRKHPILGYSLMHKGVDFAAPTGTPIYAAGDGFVKYVGRKGAYGRYIRIKHNSEYSSAYAHIHRYAKGIKPGKRVKQGQLIAYVGSSGRSTGPHLHYEIIRKGRQINPMKIKNSPRINLVGQQLDQFQAQQKQVQYIADLLKNRTVTKLASK